MTAGRQKSDRVNFYLLYGEDKGIIKKRIEDIRKKIEVNEDDVSYYDINDIEDIVNDALTISMFSLNKLIVIDSTSYLSGKKEVPLMEKLEDYFDSYNSNSYLVFVSYSSTVDSRRKLVKLITAKGKSEKVEATLEYLISFANDYVKSNDYNITKEDINYLIDRCGNNLDNLTNELDKLMLYKVSDRVITKADINILVSENFDNSVYDLVNCILKKDKSKAIEIYNNFIQNGMDVNQIIAVIAAQIRLLFQVKRLYNSGKSNDEIAKILEFRSVYRVKYLLSDSYYYTEEDLLRYLSYLANLDNNIKSGTIDGNVFLELFILEKDM